MKGQVLAFDSLKGEGIISSEDGERYGFLGTEWRGTAMQLKVGAKVDFHAADGKATEVYLVPGSPAAVHQYAPGEKSPIAAGLLALFLGGLGIHKFYLGYNTEGAILLGALILSWLTVIIGIGFLGLFAIGIITLIEAIVYLTKSPAEFQATYVDNRRPWF